MKDSEGTIWQEIRLSEHDIIALVVARRLVLRAMKEEPPGSTLWSNGAGSVIPSAVLINIDRLIEDWASASEYETEMGSDGGEQ